MKTLKDNPVLAGLVRDVKLEWSSPDEYGATSPERDDGLANKKSNKLLALLPNVESLRVRNQRDCSPFIPEFLKRNPAPKL